MEGSPIVCVCVLACVYLLSSVLHVSSPGKGWQVLRPTWRCAPLWAVIGFSAREDCGYNWKAPRNLCGRLSSPHLSLGVSLSLLQLFPMRWNTPATGPPRRHPVFHSYRRVRPKRSYNIFVMYSIWPRFWPELSAHKWNVVPCLCTFLSLCIQTWT
jgi:hypothetical protein